LALPDHPDGGIKQFHGVGHPVFSESGELVEIIGAAIDVTERKRATRRGLSVHAAMHPGLIGPR